MTALEAWKCRNVRLTTAHQIRTLQLDLSHTVELVVPSLDLFGTLVWNSVEQLSLTFPSTPEHSTLTGFAQLLPLHPDSSLITDQFIIRVSEGALLHERCIRLNNGFLSTEREAVEWERKERAGQGAVRADVPQGQRHHHTQERRPQGPRWRPTTRAPARAARSSRSATGALHS